MDAHPSRHVIILVSERRTRKVGPERLHDEFPDIVEVYQHRFNGSSGASSEDGKWNGAQKLRTLRFNFQASIDDARGSLRNDWTRGTTKPG